MTAHTFIYNIQQKFQFQDVQNRNPYLNSIITLRLSSTLQSVIKIIIICHHWLISKRLYFRYTAILIRSKIIIKFYDCYISIDLINFMTGTSKMSFDLIGDIKMQYCIKFCTIPNFVSYYLLSYFLRYKRNTDKQSFLKNNN